MSIAVVVEICQYPLTRFELRLVACSIASDLPGRPSSPMYSVTAGFYFKIPLEN
jgi:hypothetical protein